MQYENRNYWAFIWHALFLSITATFTEINTVIPSMILEIGGREIHIGIVSGIMIGIPLISQLSFAGLLHGKPKKKPFLIGAISLRVTALAAIAVTLTYIRSFSVSAALIIIYTELTLFTAGGSFAGISYIDLLGKSINQKKLQQFFPKKQIISGVGTLVSALIARHILASLPYPASYSVLFGAAALFLLVASFGFWMIHEEPSSKQAAPGFLKTLASIPTLMRQDANLRHYILFNNFIGFSVALTPFYIALAKRAYFLDPALVGSVLFVQILGNIIASFLWPLIVKRWGYKFILRLRAIGAILLPCIALIVSSFAPLEIYISLFAILGALISAQMVSQDALTVNLSTEENRVLYTGVIGTFSLTVTFFPLALGVLIRLFGYTPLFIGVASMALAANLFLSRLKCPREQNDVSHGEI